MTPNTIRRAATNRPDTSPKAVASVLREAAQYARISATHNAYPSRDGKHPFNADARDDDLRNARNLDALADALDAAPTVTWEERVERAADAFDCVPMRGDNANRLTRFYAALRAAFPEYAPDA